MQGYVKNKLMIVERKVTAAIIKEFETNKVINPEWVSLVNKAAKSYEIHIQPETMDMTSLGLIVKKHKLALQERNGLFIIDIERGEET
jgi:hypothetical protein